MQIIQFSAGKGPEECCLAVAKVLTKFCQEASINGINVTILEKKEGVHRNTLHSAVLLVNGINATVFVNRWLGVVQWVCQSSYRPRHKRKNWFIGVTRLKQPEHISEEGIRFETMRSSGAGGQHVNKTDSAVRATHIETGLTIKVQSERSQHANKRLAKLLLINKLEAFNHEQKERHKLKQHEDHQMLARGNPSIIFYGEQLVEK